jgi:hypothetical protein
MKKFLLAGLALFASVGFANAQLWPNDPIVGGGSYCSSTLNGVCITTVPAGPAITGSETVPVDTNAPLGMPQTGKISLPSLGAGPYQYVVPLTGQSMLVNPTTRHVILEPAGTISAFTILFPNSYNLTDGQRLTLCGTQIVTTLTLTAGSGTTISTPATAMLVPVATGAASCVGWLYRTANTTWYRVQ